MTHSRLAANKSASASVLATSLNIVSGPCARMRSPTVRPSIRSPTAMKWTTGGTVGELTAGAVRLATGWELAVAPGVGSVTVGTAVSVGLGVVVGAAVATVGAAVTAVALGAGAGVAGLSVAQAASKQ